MHESLLPYRALLFSSLTSTSIPRALQELPECLETTSVSIPCDYMACLARNLRYFWKTLWFWPPLVFSWTLRKYTWKDFHMVTNQQTPQDIAQYHQLPLWPLWILLYWGKQVLKWDTTYTLTILRRLRPGKDNRVVMTTKVKKKWLLYRNGSRCVYLTCTYTSE